MYHTSTHPHNINVMYAIGDSVMCQLIFIAFYNGLLSKNAKNMVLVLTLQFSITGTYRTEALSVLAQTFLHVQLNES